jgi:hypothetical protein
MQSYKTVVGDLRSGVCRCGARKVPKQFLCRGCYWRLPEAYRTRLWRRYPSQGALCLVYTRALGYLGLLKGQQHELAL